MKTCTCRQCGRVFTVAKPMPFCSGTCRVTYEFYKLHQPTIQAGVINDNSSTEKD
jgi:hypothetical protein